MLDTPLTAAYAVTPSDSAKLPQRPRAIYITGAGNLVVKFNASDDYNITFAVTAGQWLYISPAFVRASSTTASGIIALY